MTVNRGLFTSNTDLWSTPQDFFDKLNEEFDFILDVCADLGNAKCEAYFDREMDGLKMTWSDFAPDTAGRGAVWMNPPYGREIGKWVQKAYAESLLGATVVCLLPARTDTRWWHDYVQGKASEIRFVRGRLKFGGSKNSAPFPSVVVVYRPPSAAVGEAA